jgi:hypothetical protein
MLGKVRRKSVRALCKSHVYRLSYAICGEIHSQNMSAICRFNWMLDSELGETSACLGDFVGASLKILGESGITLCEFGSQFIECMLVTLLTDSRSLQLCVF